MKQHIRNIRSKTKQQIKTTKGSIKRHKTLVANFGYLSALQVFNMILPLITYPYLIRVLGAEIYGLVVFAQTVVQYFTMFVSFGFDVSATKDVSVYRNDKKKLTEIVSSVLIVRIILFIFAFAILTGLIYFIPSFREEYLLYYFCMGQCLNQVLFPVWFFQGIEKMKYITIIQVITRLITASLVFIVITEIEDFLYLPLLSAIGFLMGGIIAFWMVFKKERVRFVVQPFRVMYKYMRESFVLFVALFSARLYTSANKLVVGVFLSMTEVAYYDLAEKLVTAVKIPVKLITQTLFPKTSKDRDKSFVKKMMWLSLFMNIAIFLGMIVGGKYIVVFLGGETMAASNNVLRLLIITLPVTGLGLSFGVQMLIPFGYKKQFTKAKLSSVGIFLIIFGILYVFNSLQLYEITLMAVLVEIWITGYMFILCKKYKLI